MSRYTCYDPQMNAYFERILAGYHAPGTWFKDPTDNHLCKVVTVEGKVFLGKKD